MKSYIKVISPEECRRRIISLLSKTDPEIESAILPTIVDIYSYPHDVAGVDPRKSGRCRESRN